MPLQISDDVEYPPSFTAPDYQHITVTDMGNNYDNLTDYRYQMLYQFNSFYAISK